MKHQEEEKNEVEMHISQLESGLLKKHIGENDENHKLNSEENPKETGLGSYLF